MTSGPARRDLVGGLRHGDHNPAPSRRPIIVAGKRWFVSSCSTFVERLFAIALEHEMRRPPDVDFGYQSGRLINLDLRFAKPLKRAILPVGRNVDSSEGNHEASSGAGWHRHGGRSFYRMRAPTAVKQHGDVWHTYYAWTGQTRHDEQRGHAGTHSQLFARSACQHAA